MSDSGIQSDYDFDLFVIGVGSGGVRAARMSATYGARVATAEDRYMGGTCVNVGCVPKKLFVYASHFSEEYRHAEGFGWDAVSPDFDWPTLRDNKNTEISRLNGIYRGMLDNAGVTHFDGRARIEDAHTISINGQRVTTDRILIATGSWPTVPDFPGREHVLTSNEAFFLDALPRRSLVVGGGYIAVEFAGIFNGLGVESHLSYRGSLFLRHFDGDVRTTVAEELERKGVMLHFESRVTEVREVGTSFEVTFDDGRTEPFDLILYATGRHPAVEDIGLENVAVETRDNGAIIVDDEFRTSVPNIFALGDVIDRMQLTPVAISEAMVFARNQFLGETGVMDYENVPTAVFCQPNIGTVGLTEEEARQQFSDDITVYKSGFRAMKHTLSGSGEKTLMKMVVQTSTDRVLGVHMVGAEAGEIIQGIAVALKAGATKKVFDSTIGIHPTTAEELVTMREPVSTSG
jgi:glutathione reductase (NADPH)